MQTICVRTNFGMSLISKCKQFQRFNQKLREHSIISFLTQRVSFTLKINSCASQTCASKGKWRAQPRLSGRDRGLNSPNFASTVKSSLTLFTLLSVFWSVLLNSNCKFILSFSKKFQVFIVNYLTLQRSRKSKLLVHIWNIHLRSSGLIRVQ